VGDVAQVIAGVEGCYICRRDPADMADKLKQALNRGRRTSGRRVIQSLGLETTVDSVLHIYEELW
jgi:hypothetical protein